jgi:YesN/AraC family two-component response regulator
MSTENVLVVDDEPDIREGIILLNKIPNRTFKSASNGLEALEMLSNENFDVVVSDISMPKMSGTDLIRAAREKGIQIPFIFISGLSDSNVNHKLQQCSGWYLIEKTDIKKVGELISELVKSK